MTQIDRHRTALKRTGLSRPMRLALEDKLIAEDSTVFDYGCGHGGDIKRLKKRGISCTGWDPVHRPTGEKQRAQIVNLGYVVNVIENLRERIDALKGAWDLAESILVVSARLHTDLKDSDRSTDYADGRLTRLNTFQKYYDQRELRDWIDAVLGVSAVPAAPGVFYAFRDGERRQSFVASRYRRARAAPRLRQSDIQFEQHKDLLAPLIDFVAARGRLPQGTELATAAEIEHVFGTLPRAFALVRRVTGKEPWEQIKEERKSDFLIYLALAAFDNRPRFSELPEELRLDVRSFFSNHKRACAEADKLLYSAGDQELIDATCRSATIGKETPSALYVHRSAIPLLPPILRVYEGCASGFIGEVEDATIIKLTRGAPKISYLTYDAFDKDPHPTLQESLQVLLSGLRVKRRSYRKSENPPILHRKELFVGPDYLGREKFARLTRQEESWGLFANPSEIGTRTGWCNVLERTGVQLRGHRVVRA